MRNEKISQNTRLQYKNVLLFSTSMSTHLLVMGGFSDMYLGFLLIHIEDGVI